MSNTKLFGIFFTQGNYFLRFPVVHRNKTMEQTLTYNRKNLINTFEKATEIKNSVKIDTILEAKQIINHLIRLLEIHDLNIIENDFIVPDFNKDTIKIRFTAKDEKLNHKDFISNIKIFNDYILSTNQ